MKKLCLMVVLLLTFGSIALAADAEGSKVLQKMDQVMKSESKLLEEEMILITSDGQERMRKIRVWNSNLNGEEKMLLRFLEPESVQGTGFMMDNDEMWLYLPALGKVRRIAGHAKKGNFMGSDLSYEDMEAIGNKGFSKDYQVSQMVQSRLGEHPVYQLDLIPTGEVSYSKLTLWVDETMYLPLQIHYYDEKGNLTKTLNTAEHQQIQGRWTAFQIKVKDEKKGSTTVLKVSSVQFDLPLDAELFTTRNLERGQ